MYFGLELIKKFANEDWVMYMNHDAMKLLLGDGPKDGGGKNLDVMALKGEMINVSKFILKVKGELKNWKYEEESHQKGKISKFFRVYY